MTRPLLTEPELVDQLRHRARPRGAQKRVAHDLGIAQGTLSNILTQGRGIGPQLAQKLGYRRVIRFERIDR